MGEIEDLDHVYMLNWRYVSREDPRHPLPSGQRAAETPWIDYNRRDMNGKLHDDEVSTIKRLILRRMRERKRRRLPRIPTLRKEEASDGSSNVPVGEL